MDPIKTTTIPRPFKRVMGVAKTTVDMTIIRTCLTFPAMVRVKGDVILFVIRLVMFRELVMVGKRENGRLNEKMCVFRRTKYTQYFLEDLQRADPT